MIGHHEYTTKQLRFGYVTCFVTNVGFSLQNMLFVDTT